MLLLLLLAVLASVAAAAASSVKLVSVESLDNDHVLIVKFQTDNDNDTPATFRLRLDTTLFSPHLQQQPKEGGLVLLSYMSASPTPTNWAAAQYSPSTRQLVSGHFSSPELGGYHALDQEVVRRVLLDGHNHDDNRTATFSDEVVQATNRPDLSQYLFNLRTQLRTGSSNDVVDDNSFTPGCYPNDQFAHTVKLGFAVDQGYMDKIGGATTLAEVQANIESFFGPVRVLYLAQLNLYLQIDHILLPTTSDTTVLAATPTNNKCAANGAMQTLSRFEAFVSSAGHSSQAALWHLLTDCHASPGTVGAAYVGGMCLARTNTGISSWTRTSLWLTVAHELGHGFGAMHTFEQGGQGGVMDYGNGRYRGSQGAEFHPLNRLDMCPVVAFAVDKKRCEHIALTTQQQRCGNGLLELGEECECVDQTKTSCGQCKQCQLPASSSSVVECSTGEYVVRTNGQATEAQVVSSALLASKECCSSKGVLVKRAAACGASGNTCSATGQCAKTCSKFGLPACSNRTRTDTTEFHGECVQQCLYEEKCWGAELTTMGPPAVPVGAVPDGVKCGRRGEGQCKSGVCEEPYTDQPSFAPTSGPTVLPTASPTASPSFDEEEEEGGTWAPTTMDFSTLKCPNLPRFQNCPGKNRDACLRVRTGCEWCNGACKVSAVSCNNMRVPYKVMYAHCPPFKKKQ